MRKSKEDGFFYLTVGMIISLAIVLAMFLFGGSAVAGEFFLYETIPFYDYDSNGIIGDIIAGVKKATNGSVQTAKENDGVTSEVFSQKNESSQKSDGSPQSVITQLDLMPQSNYDLIGTNDIMFQPDIKNNEPELETEPFTTYTIDDLRNIEYLKSNFFTVDKETELLASYIDAAKFLEMSQKIEQNQSKPTVLIFHTHSTESFAGSDPNNMFEGIVGAGEYLKNILLERYGITAIHVTSRFDIVNGKSQILGAYERMEPVIMQILTDNPSVQVVLDLHRDGVNDDTKFVTEINGKPTARLMFVNGLSLLKENDKLRILSNLPNVNQEANLAFSFNMQIKLNEMFPGLTRKIYLRAYRYSLHMLPKSLLVEIGNQNNTFQEAKNAMDLFAKALAEVILP